MMEGFESMESKDELQKIRIGAVEQLGALPKVLKELQELVPLLSVAYSTDGRTFGYEAPLSMSITVGSYVALSLQNGGEYLGQLVTKEVSVRKGAEISLELDPSLSALLPQGISFSAGMYRQRARIASRAPILPRPADAWRPNTSLGKDGRRSTSAGRFTQPNRCRRR